MSIKIEEKIYLSTKLDESGNQIKIWDISWHLHIIIIVVYYLSEKKIGKNYWKNDIKSGIENCA